MSSSAGHSLIRSSASTDAPLFEALGTSSPKLLLSQYSDTATLSKTLTMLEVYRSHVVLMPDTVDSRGLVMLILEEHAAEDALNLNIVSFPRKFFSEVKGAETLTQVSACHPGSELGRSLLHLGHVEQVVVGHVADKAKSLQRQTTQIEKNCAS